MVRVSAQGMRLYSQPTQARNPVCTGSPLSYHSVCNCERKDICSQKTPSLPISPYIHMYKLQSTIHQKQPTSFAVVETGLLNLYSPSTGNAVAKICLLHLTNPVEGLQNLDKPVLTTTKLVEDLQVFSNTVLTTAKLVESLQKIVMAVVTASSII